MMWLVLDLPPPFTDRLLIRRCAMLPYSGNCSFENADNGRAGSILNCTQKVTITNCRDGLKLLAHFHQKALSVFGRNALDLLIS